MGPMSLVEAYRVALEVQTEYGLEAKSAAARHIERCKMEGDLNGLSFWTQVHRVLGEIERQSSN